MRCGSLGGGHGHFDKGHLELVIGGEEVLADPGRYTYVDGTERRMLKSTKAHNTVTVDGENILTVLILRREGTLAVRRRSHEQKRKIRLCRMWSSGLH